MGIHTVKVLSGKRGYMLNPGGHQDAVSHKMMRYSLNFLLQQLRAPQC